MEALNCETIREEEVSIMICRIPDEHDTFFDSHQLPEFYAEELNKISSDKRRREFITARVAINQLLGKEVRIVYDKAGKPLLSNHEGHISISHSRKFLALIYHPCKAVGIDIECPSERVLKVSQRFLNDTELGYFEGQLLKIQIAWSVKEALYKMLGEDYVDFAASMLIHDFEPADTGKLYCEDPRNQKVYALNYMVRPEFNLAYSISEL